MIILKVSGKPVTCLIDTEDAYSVLTSYIGSLSSKTCSIVGVEGTKCSTYSDFYQILISKLCNKRKQLLS